MSRTLPLDTRSTPGRLVDVSTMLTSASLLDRRFRFGYQMAFVAAISEIDRQSDDQPYDKTDPCGYIEERHHSEADNHSEDRDHGNERRSVRPRRFQMSAPHNDDADAHDNEGQQGADARHIAQIGDRQKSRKQTDEHHQQQIRTPGSAEGGMDI